MDERENSQNTEKREAEKPEDVAERYEKSGKTNQKVKGSRTKKTFGRKFLDKMLSNDPIGVSERVKNEVIWPGLKDLGYNILMSAISMAFWGEVRGNYSRNGGRGGTRSDRYTDYSGYSRNDSRPRVPDRRNTPSYDYGEIIFATRRDAEEALDHLIWCINKYNQAAVADLNEKAELSSKYTDRYYGWYDLRNAAVIGTSEGWILDLPPCEPLRTQ